MGEVRTHAVTRKWNKLGANTANHATATQGLSSPKARHKNFGRRQHDHQRTGENQVVTGAPAQVPAKGVTRAIEQEAEVEASSRASNATLMRAAEPSFNKSMQICSNDTTAKVATPVGRDPPREALPKLTIAATAAVVMTVPKDFMCEAGNRAGQGASPQLLQGQMLGTFSHIALSFMRIGNLGSFVAQCAAFCCMCLLSCREPGLRIKTRLSLQEHQQQHQHVLMSPAPQPRRRASAVANMRGHHNHHTPSPRAQAAAAAAAASRKVAPNPSNSAAKKQSQHHRQLSRDSGSQRLHMSGGATSDASFPFSPAAQQAAAAAAASRKVRLQQSGGAMSEDSGSFQSSISSKADADVPLPARRPSRVITRTVLDASRSGRDSSRGSGSRSRSKQPPPSRRRSIHDDEYSDSGSESGISAGEERNFADPHNSSSPMGRALLDSSFAHPGCVALYCCCSSFCRR